MRVPLSLPVLVYDGTCAFCRRWVARWRARTGKRVRYLPSQLPGVLPALGLSKAQAQRSVQLVEPGRRKVSTGAVAVFRALLRAPSLRWAARLALVPPVRWIAQWVYRRIARHRRLAGRIDSLLFGKSVTPPRTQLVRKVFQRALGGVYFAAFTSLGSQLLGLYGRRGIRPVAELLSQVRERVGSERYRLLPTVFWFADSDQALKNVCRAGQGASLALLLGITPTLSALAAWALYLSFVSVGQEFLSFQWDALLLEAGLLTIIGSPTGLMRWLAFRVHFESGLAKLQSGDETWRTLTACRYHFETQPLPNRPGWYAHHLPEKAKRVATASVLFLEGVAPFLAWGPRRLRRLGFWLFAGLQGVFALTGNYGFFNLLSAVLCLWLLDDEALQRVLPPAPAKRRWRTILETIAAAPVVALCVSEFTRRFRRAQPLLEKLGPLSAGLARLEEVTLPFRSVNSYGLFSVMTVRRPEIIIEGSNDGQRWLEYEFHYKAGALERPPLQVAPHQPRLDWQMWFAALGRPSGWFISFLVRLLEGSPEVIGLLRRNPFPGSPPRYVRAVLYDYRMSTLDAHRRTGAWWERERLGLYLPPIALAAPQDDQSRGQRDRRPMVMWN